jgi:hypothetical protein
MTEIDNRNKSNLKAEIPEKKRYQTIFKANPSFKDCNLSYTVPKTIFLIVLILNIILFSYIAWGRIFTALGIGFVLVILFVFAFHEELFSLKDIFCYRFRKFDRIKPFQDMVFWYEKKNQNTIFISNKKDLTHIGVKIFSVEVLAENVEPNLGNFLQVMSESHQMVNYTYQVIQTPLYTSPTESRSQELSSQEGMMVKIYFAIYYRVKGILNEKRFHELKYKLELFTGRIQSNFAANYHHHKMSLIVGNALLNALRTIYMKDIQFQKIPQISEKLTLNETYNNSLNLRKLLVISTIIFYFNFVLFCLFISTIIILTVNLVIVIFLIYLWWRGLLFQFSKKIILSSKEITVCNPFKGVQFFKFKKYSNSLFITINNSLLIGVKMSNLKYIFSPPIAHGNKFCEGIITRKIPFCYTVACVPITFYRFYKDGFNYLKKRVQANMLYNKLPEYRIDSGNKELNWLQYRKGMWRVVLTLSTFNYKWIESLKVRDIVELEEQLNLNNSIIKNAFKQSHPNYEILSLQKKTLLSGLVFMMGKQRLFRLSGTHLYYVMMQGTTLIGLTRIINVLMKGLEARIGAEFNTPTYLENLITFGYTINTEVLEEEVLAGFTLEQLKKLLVIQGLPFQRDLLCMKIVSELIKSSLPSIIFDFNGEWSRLFSYFQGTRFEEHILYFKIGTNFSVDPLHSDIPYDKNNLEYLNYFFDAFALAFKRDQRSMELLRNTILRNPEMSLPSLNLAIQNQQEILHQGNSTNNILLTLFNDLTQQDMVFFHGTGTHIEGRIVPSDFINNDKTIIIDLSTGKELNMKLFLTFIIISKLIHYLSKDNQNEYTEKILVIPHVDLFFDAFYLDYRSNYGKINKFLDPLLEKGFGFIYNANQICYIHSNVFTYFNNLITFRATDTRDISVLKNQMNLQELHGTGYYSRSRSNTYQIDYLMNMEKNEVIVKRSDIHQAFPAIIEWDTIRTSPKVSQEYIDAYMERQGFDLRTEEERIKQHAKKTLFEKDLGRFYSYLPEIMKFFEAISTVDQVGNLYEPKVKEQLKEVIAPKASKQYKKRAETNKMVEELFELLKKHQYLVESHPRKAGGGETIRPSYSVGVQYKRALDDLMKSKQRSVKIQPIVKESNEDLLYSERIIPERSPYIIKSKDLKDALAIELRDLWWEIYTTYKYIIDEDFKNALKLEQNLIKHFFTKVYEHYYQPNYVVTDKDLLQFIALISEAFSCVFSKEELLNYFEKYTIINFEQENLEELSKEIYLFYSDFFNKLQKFIEKK